MTDLESQQLVAYRNIAFEIISRAIEELKSGQNPTTSAFIESPWFSVVCQVSGGDTEAIRKIARRLPGYMGNDKGKDLSFVPRSDIDPRLVPLSIKNREGRCFTVYGYMRAGILIGCSHQAVALAVKEGRVCQGWEVERIREGAIA
jgi:hypothetical protein